MESYNIETATKTRKAIGLMELVFILPYLLDLDTPVITLAPSNNTIIARRALNLTCNAIGSESVTYNWLLRNRTNVTSNIFAPLRAHLILKQ